MRVQRTFAFIDVSGFTSLTDTEGDEVAVSVVAAFRGAVRDICSRRGVRIAKWLGDGAMLVGVDSTAVVAAALESQRCTNSAGRATSIRCGLAIGPVILLEGDDYIGSTVNLSARLCDAAAAGEVLAAEDLEEHLPPWAVTLRFDEIPIRGMSRPQGVLRLGLASADGEGERDPVCGLPLTKRTAVVERADGGGLLLFCSESCLETWEGRLAHGG